MRAVDATLAALKRAGVNAIFGLPGGPVIPLFDALHDDPDIRTFLVRHEQGAGHMAEGYAKVTGRAGAAALGDVEGLGEGEGEVLGVLDQPGVLHHREGDPDDVGLLEGVGTESMYCLLYTSPSPRDS